MFTYYNALVGGLKYRYNGLKKVICPSSAEKSIEYTDIDLFFI